MPDLVALVLIVGWALAFLAYLWVCGKLVK